jgi:hypothetical protein
MIPLTIATILTTLYAGYIAFNNSCNRVILFSYFYQTGLEELIDESEDSFIHS